jgi:hypothetical protein
MIGFRRGTAALAGVAVFASILAAFFFTGCATAPKSPAPAPVEVKGTEPLFVADPVLADSADSLLTGLGWGGGRLGRELKKEMVYQFNRRGVAVAEDSAKAKATLAVSLEEYSRKGEETRYSVSALLKTEAGERTIRLRKAPKGAEGPERDDPTVDNIRIIAAYLVEESGKDPRVKKKTPKKSDPEYYPAILIPF